MISPKMYIDKYKDKSLEELKNILDDREKYLISDELKKLREQEVKMLIKDNCVTRVEIEIQVLKDLITEKKQIHDLKKIDDNELKKLIEEQIGNNDPYYCEPAFNIIKKVINMDYMKVTTIAELAKEFNYEYDQIFELYGVVLEICKNIGIELGFPDSDERQFTGLPQNYKFMKVSNSKIKKTSEEKISRKDELLKILDLPKTVRNLEQKAQYQILYDTIIKAQTWIKNEYNSIARGEYIPSKRQDATWQNALINFQRNDYLNCYYEIMDFIDDYGNRDTLSFYKQELDNVSSILNGITQKIKELIDLKESNTTNSVFNIDLLHNQFNISMAEGSVLDKKNIKTIELDGNNLKLCWNGIDVNLDLDFHAKSIREIITKYEREINQYAKKPRGAYSVTGTIIDSFCISINGEKYYIDTLTISKVKDIFYNKMKDEIYDYINRFIVPESYANSYIRTYKIGKDGHIRDEITVLDEPKFDVNINTNVDKSSPEHKYCGTAGIISINNLLIH